MWNSQCGKQHVPEWPSSCAQEATLVEVQQQKTVLRGWSKGGCAYALHAALSWHKAQCLGAGAAGHPGSRRGVGSRVAACKAMHL